VKKTIHVPPVTYDIEVVRAKCEAGYEILELSIFSPFDNAILFKGSQQFQKN